MIFEDLNKNKIYIRPHWLQHGEKVPMHIIAYSDNKGEWMYLNAGHYILKENTRYLSRVDSTVREACDLVEFNVEQNNALIKELASIRKTPSLDTDECKGSILRDKKTRALYRWSRAGKEWREIFLYTLDFEKKCEYRQINREWNIDQLQIAYDKCDYTLTKSKNKNSESTKENKMARDKDYTGKARIVVVQYVTDIHEVETVGGNQYAFKCEPTLKLKDGDTVVVDDTNGLNTCIVVEVLNDDTDVTYHARMARAATAWIVNKVNVKPHLKRIKNTEELKQIEVELNELKLAAIKKKKLEEELELLSSITGSEALIKRREALLNN